MGLKGGAIAGIVIGCVVFVVAKTACMVVFFQWWYRRRQRILASRRGKVDVEKGTPLEKLAAAMNLKNKGGSTGTSSAGTSVSSLGSAQSLPGWVMDEKDIEILKFENGKPYLLGSGSFGTVYKALRQGVQSVAVKQITQADEWQLGQFIKEINLMEKLSFDRNIVQFYGAVLSGTAPMLILEYMEGGDLRDALSHQEDGELSWYQKGHLVALDVVRGLVFLHSNKVVHADLKGKNILLTQNAGTIGYVQSEVTISSVIVMGASINRQLMSDGKPISALPASLGEGVPVLGVMHTTPLFNLRHRDIVMRASAQTAFSGVRKVVAAGTAKIADVGLARIMQHTLSNTATGDPAGTFAYAAPEMLMGEKWDDKADIYSLGVLLWEIVTAEIPERGRMRPVQVPEECPQAVANIIHQCMMKDAVQRPNARQVYDAMQQVLQGERGLPIEPVRVVNTDPRLGSMNSSTGTDTTYSSVNSSRANSTLT